MSDTPNPGSNEALAQGCKCARMDNGYGRGAYGGILIEGRPQFWTSQNCPLHGWEEARDGATLPGYYI